MALPKALKAFAIYRNGKNFMGETLELTLPQLSRKTEPYRGGGMQGTVQIDLGMADDGLSHEWTVGGILLEALRDFAIARADGVQLRFAGSYQQDDTGEVHAVEIVTRGRHTEFDMGSAKSGEKTEHKIKSALTYYKLTVNGRVEIEIDILNHIHIVDGVDRLAEHRAAMGL